jgi:flavin reductase (DIM6/NTAB) family NADH-FMN oxidoreductase RutF
MYAWPTEHAATEAPTDDKALRRALGAFPTGVCLVSTVSADGKREGMTINSFASVSLTPPLILWSVRDVARSAEAFLNSRHFVLSVLAADQQGLAAHFARPAPDKFADWEAAFEPGLGGCPRLRHSVATFECRLYSCHQEGDHSILVGRVEAYRHTDTPPLFFHGGRMGSLWDLAEALPAPHA